MGIQVFVSYNRSNAALAYLLHDRLEARLNCKVLIDSNFLKPGENFVRAIEQAQSSASIMIVIITKEWLFTDQAAGGRPVDDPDNWVRREVAAALGQQTRVIPVLSGGVSMPAEADLPEDISPLAHCHAISIRDSEIDSDVERLLKTLEGEIGEALIGSVKEFDRRRVVTDVAYYFPRFLKLIVVPKRVIRAFSASREEELASALTFLTVSLLIFTAFSVPLFIEKDRMIALLLVQFIMLAMLAFCSSAILQVSWRWVGGTADFSRYLSINSYYWGVSSVLVLCLVISALGVIKVFDPHMLKLLRRAAAGDVAPLIAFHPRKSTPLRVAAWIILIGNLLLPFWTYAFWGAYREINDNTTRLHSFFAFGISSIIFIPVGLLFALMQQGLFNLLR